MVGDVPLRLVRGCVMLVVGAITVSPGGAAEPPDFNRDVRPILANHCWNCHGPDQHSRQAGLRLDHFDAATAKLESGDAAIVPGDPAASGLMHRILSADETVVMPPPAFKQPLSDGQKRILERWIAAGATFAGHWAFTPPVRREPPATRDTAWPRNEIDRFVLAKLEAEGIAPAAEADRPTWLRRVTLDLTGLPPTPDELDAFVADGADGAHERVVDRLLASPRHAERLAALWLDAARYADTNGYNNDETRTMWPWRDWVIRAHAANMPFDRFLTEQLAGDLLPEPTLDQRVATGFNRNHVLTTEGGVVEEEYHVEYVADRIHTTATVFLGLSLQCARCHDHKFDPLTQRDYYRFAAFLNNVPDRIVPYSQGRMAGPLLAVPSPEQEAEMAGLRRRQGELDAALAARAAACHADLAAWEAALTPERIAALATTTTAVARFDFDAEPPAADAVEAGRVGRVDGAVTFVAGRAGKGAAFAGGHIDLGQLGDFDADEPFTLAASVQRTAGGALAICSKIDEAAGYRGYDFLLEEGRPTVHVSHAWPASAFKVVAKVAVPLDEWRHVAAVYDGGRSAAGMRLYVDGKPVDFDVTTNNRVAGPLKTAKPFHIGKRFSTLPFAGRIDDVQVFATALSAEEVARVFAGESAVDLKEILATPADRRSPQARGALERWWLERIDETSRGLRAERTAIPGRLQAIEAAVPQTMVMAETEPRRPTFILERGSYDARREQVTAGVPEGIAALPAGAPANRLGLARWLTDPAHPLTARVAVNRWWELFFGVGIVETVEDFGVQGSYPSHPDLLDWMATQLVADGWNQRATLRRIVLSATYRQSSRARPELHDRDPDNRLLARGPRHRLTAEALRDGALFVAGLLGDKIGGPSVKPYQPDGLWEEISVDRREKYAPDPGDGVYRRGMYTFWKRTCPPPAMTTFDAPDRETCIVRRARTNTPLQALVLLNDPTFVEAARKLADRVMAAGADDAARARALFRLVLAREPTAAEHATVARVNSAARAKFTADPAAAEKLLQVGRAARDPRFPAPEAAAWAATASVVLNSSEAVTKP